MPAAERRPGRRPVSLVLMCLALTLVLLPLPLAKPRVIKSDEAAYYLASLSLWHDHDMACEDIDTRRLFREFPGTGNLKLTVGTGEPKAHFGVPFVYPLVAAPMVALLGSNGMMVLNAVLFIAMIWMAVSYLRRFNRESTSVLFAVGFFLLSTSLVYVFWLQAEIFTMTCVMAAYYLIDRSVGERHRSLEKCLSGRRLFFRVAGSAVLLATASFSRPMLAVLAIPLLFLIGRAGLWRSVATFIASAAVSIVLLTGSTYLLTGHLWPYFAPRVGVALSSPVDYTERTVSSRKPARNSLVPIGRLKDEGRRFRFAALATLRTAVPEFLFGRHGGFFIYMPFAVVSILFFLVNRGRSAFKWLILGSAALTAILFITLVRGYWLGGGGSVGNRYFLAVYPTFLFLVGRIRPAWLVACGFGAAAFLLGPILMNPMTATSQAHLRNQPFPLLPFEWSLVKSLGSYHTLNRAGVSFHGRRDEMGARNEEIWVPGARRVEISMITADPQRSFVFDVRNLAPQNTIEICVQDDCRQLTFDQVPARGSTERVKFGPLKGDWIPQAGRPKETFKYRLTVDSDWGEQPRWRGSGNARFYLGAALSLMGSLEDVSGENHQVEWLRVDAPPSIRAGTHIAVPVRLRNSSGLIWKHQGPTKVRIGSRWRDETGKVIGRAGPRTRLPGDITAGETLDAEITIEAPKAPGRYILQIDLLRERLGWFSRNQPTMAYRVDVDILAPDSRADPIANPQG